MDTAKLIFNNGSDQFLDTSDLIDWDIVVSADAIASEKYAAEELQNYFKNLFGRVFLINNSAEDRSKHIFIGASAAQIDNSEMGDEEFRVIVKPDQIAIVGGEPRGTLYGVYQFLEDGFGVRFLTFDHDHVPPGHDLDLPCGDYRYDAPFSFRWSYYRENSDHPDFAARRRINTVTPHEKLGGSTPQHLINHSFHRWMPFAKYGDDHPEYYALVDGKRDTDTHGAGPQLCVTNSEVIELTAEAVIDHLDENPDLRNISVSQADTARYCRCENCEKINESEGTPMGSQLAFVNAVADRVGEKHRNVKIGTLAYWYTRQAPKTIRPRNNVQIQLCSIECCNVHAIDDHDCEKNRSFCKDMDDWSKICADIWIWNYNTNFGCYDLPHPNLRSIDKNVRYFLRNNTKGLFMQANGNGLSGEFSDLRNYIISSLIWNPDRDGEAVCEEFVRLHYGNSAQPILDYINAIHDNAEEKGVHPGCFAKPESIGFTAEICHRSFAYFQKAIELADNDLVRSRVEKASIPVYKAMILAGEIDEGEDRKDLIDQYIALARKYGMTHAREGQLAEDYFKELK